MEFAFQPAFDICIKCLKLNLPELLERSGSGKKVMANVGIEPKTFALLARRSNQLS